MCAFWVNGSVQTPVITSPGCIEIEQAADENRVLRLTLKYHIIQYTDKEWVL